MTRRQEDLHRPLTPEDHRLLVGWPLQPIFVPVSGCASTDSRSVSWLFSSVLWDDPEVHVRDKQTTCTGGYGFSMGAYR